MLPSTCFIFFKTFWACSRHIINWIFIWNVNWSHKAEAFMSKANAGFLQLARIPNKPSVWWCFFFFLISVYFLSVAPPPTKIRTSFLWPGYAIKFIILICRNYCSVTVDIKLHDLKQHQGRVCFTSVSRGIKSAMVGMAWRSFRSLKLTGNISSCTR